MATSRISWIDIARGIGIILVLQGHALSAHVYRHFIYAFHMPLFFFISGLLFDYKKYSFLENLKKSARGILVPYVIFAGVSYLIWMFNNSFSASPEQIMLHLIGVFYGNSSSLFFNLVLWFLPCLFITKMLFALITTFIKKDKVLIVVLFIFSLLGYFAFIYLPDLNLPFGIESALTAVVFFGAGSILRTNYAKNIDFKINKRSIAILIASLVILIISTQINYEIYGRQIDIRLNNLGNYFLFYTGAVSGIILTVLIAKIINKNMILEKIGEYALPLFVFHPFVFAYLNPIMVGLFGVEFFRQWKDLLLAPFYTAVAIIVIFLGVYFYQQLIKKIKAKN